MRPSRLLIATLVGALFAEAVVVSWMRVWGGAADPDAVTYFGGDFTAYLAGAERLLATGTPYDPVLHAGPIANVPDNVPIAYVYPPPLAQVFVPLISVPRRALAIGSTIVQATALLMLMPLVYRRFGRLTRWSLSGVMLATLASFPLHFAVYGGNMSGWITISIAVMLLEPGRRAGFAATLASWAKMTPVVLAVPALLDGRSRNAAAATALAVCGLSFVAAPSAWIDWVSVLPNILRFPPGPAVMNMSATSVFGSVGLASVGTVLGIGIAVAAASASAWLAVRRRWDAAVAAAVLALVVGPTSLWDHYLAVIVPVLIAAWPMARGSLRVALAAAGAVHVFLWLPLGYVDLRAACLAATVAGGCAAVMALSQAGPEGLPVTSRPIALPHSSSP